MKTYSIEEFNNLSDQACFELLQDCCVSQNWIKAIVSKRPFASLNALKEVSDTIWGSIDEIDWIEAFEGHPKIGDISSLRSKYISTKVFANNEQSSVSTANEEILLELKKLNDLYEKRFGYIFIICATGKTAEEMLKSLKSRIDNDSKLELKLAADEQNKITKLRLEKFICQK